MSSQNATDEWQPKFYVGYHDTSRDNPLTNEQLEQALDCNYNMLTTFITNRHFHTKINALVSDHMSGNVIPKVPHLTDLDTHLEPDSITASVVAFTSPWLDLCSPDPLIAGISKQILFMEVAFAAFCGFEQIVVQGPKLSHHDPFRGKDVWTNNVMQFARAVQECLAIGLRLQITVLLPFSDDPLVKEDNPAVLMTREDHLEPDLDPKEHSADFLGTWETWNTIRSTCKYHSRLAVALSMPPHLPTAYVQSRWFTEPLKALFFDSNSFTTNSKGYPSLQSSTQLFLKDVMRLKIPPWIMLVDVGTTPGPNSYGETQYADGYLHEDALASSKSDTTSTQGSQIGSIDELAHLNYIRHIELAQEKRSEIERYGSGYQDYLQAPLQPLTHNLESMTYEVFEKDPVKYDLYEQAIRKALRDWADQEKPRSGPHGKVVVVVAGAGRGPLVSRALRASKEENVPIDMWAVEKNPNAYVFLQRRNRTIWKQQVRLEKGDMRTWKGPWQTEFSPTPAEAFGTAGTPPEVAPMQTYHPIDILISELLGSFGDNELSPECLDGAIHLLAQPHGISIPQSYTAWVTPVAAPRLHADISQRGLYDSTAAETPAVVWLHQIDYLSRQTTYKDTNSSQQAASNSDQAPKAPNIKDTFIHGGSNSPLPPPNVLCAWEFTHKSLSNSVPQGSTDDQNVHNERFAKLNFRIRHRGVCHGLGGYFESVLYPGIELSTNPNNIGTKSPHMISWFPIFFPLKEPLYVPSTSALDVSMWRQTDGRRVWYEWMVESWGWNLMRTAAAATAPAREAGTQDEAKRGAAAKVDRRMVRLGMTELHSSIKNACLM